MDSSRSPIARIALFVSSVALTALGAEISIYVGPIPYTFQNMGLVFAGLTLPPRDALFAQLCYILLIALGLPIAAGGHGGPYILVGYTAGYLWGFPIASFLYSILSRSYLRRVRKELHNVNLKDACVLWLLSLVSAIPMYFLGFAVFYAYLSMGVSGLKAWSLRIASYLFRANPSSYPLALIALIVGVAIFVPQDAFMDHVLGLILAVTAHRVLKSRGLA